MKFDWKILLLMGLPMLEMAGQAKVNEDENETGRDDAIGQAMLFLVKLAKALALGKELPKAPPALR